VGKTILCLGKYAEKSYFIKEMNLSIFSIEELCFCLQENAYLLETDFMSLDLVEWLRQECELKELANKLAGIIKRKTSLSLFVKTILEDTFYCDPSEVEEIEHLINHNSYQNKFQKRKNLGDYFAKKKKSAQAIFIYKNLLNEYDLNDAELKSKICHNLAVMHSQFFEFEESAFYFRQANQLAPSNESYLSYLLAKRMLLSEKAYIDFIGESKKHFQMSLEAEGIIERVKRAFEDDKQNLDLDEIIACKNTSYAGEYYQKSSELIHKWKKEYRSLIE